eukprot:gnl/Chilomastix_cuspidata/2668.p1 GENE.gnl/Chilomastix_cuspidata/2668~~gnl/Chilomastix_cuspidata/2668.p1  ORF type:complete len:813 (-),score=254.31 gnl/Chilomastix_cuspidata/2668:4630-7068(-)
MEKHGHTKARPQSDTGEPISHDSLRRHLATFNKFPRKKRDVIWRYLLQLPANRKEFLKIYYASRNTPCDINSAEFLADHSQRTQEKVETIIRMLKSWIPDVDRTQWAVGLVLPFVLFFEHDIVAAFEAVVTVLWNWCKFCTDRRRMARAVEGARRVLEWAQPQLAARVGGAFAEIARPLLATLFSAALPFGEWTVLMDRILLEPPRFLHAALAAVLIVLERQAGARAVLEFRTRSPLRVHAAPVITKARQLWHALRRDTPAPAPAPAAIPVASPPYPVQSSGLAASVSPTKPRGARTSGARPLVPIDETGVYGPGAARARGLEKLVAEERAALRAARLTSRERFERELARRRDEALRRETEKIRREEYLTHQEERALASKLREVALRRQLEAEAREQQRLLAETDTFVRETAERSKERRAQLAARRHALKTQLEQLLREELLYLDGGPAHPATDDAPRPRPRPPSGTPRGDREAPSSGSPAASPLRSDAHTRSPALYSVQREAGTAPMGCVRSPNEIREVAFSAPARGNRMVLSPQLAEFVAAREARGAQSPTPLSRLTAKEILARQHESPELSPSLGAALAEPGALRSEDSCTAGQADPFNFPVPRTALAATRAPSDVLRTPVLVGPEELVAEAPRHARGAPRGRRARPSIALSESDAFVQSLISHSKSAEPPARRAHAAPRGRRDRTPSHTDGSGATCTPDFLSNTGAGRNMRFAETSFSEIPLVAEIDRELKFTPVPHKPTAVAAQPPARQVVLPADTLINSIAHRAPESVSDNAEQVARERARAAHLENIRMFREAAERADGDSVTTF